MCTQMHTDTIHAHTTHKVTSYKNTTIYYKNYLQLFHALLGHGELLGDALSLEVDQQRQLVLGRVQLQEPHQHLWCTSHATNGVRMTE